MGVSPAGRCQPWQTSARWLLQGLCGGWWVLLNPLQSLWTGDTGTTQSATARAAFRHRSLPCRAPPVRFAEPDTTWWCPLPEQRHNQKCCPCLAGAPQHCFSLNYQSLICQKSSAVPSGGLAVFFCSPPSARAPCPKYPQDTQSPGPPAPGGQVVGAVCGVPAGSCRLICKKGGGFCRGEV